ncbi:carbohydrate kinase family protein [Bifidobacterium callimiconis]|uniref:2-dehydro-3-deoxygluconokinase n=1 Tax=Bifidobacterium callimiconis TaxID=2306973 RepID=A0A430FFE8_9BIFI|nr:carbohydrate kinase [Bifidobacterium callimiconis]MBT1176181.1 carbohydrate kinase [Bifidobacterium callimiconis]RSX51472.1 2-dehydro-3-deoxygluconokinase [Bifidobacterium callimiconis]
MTDKKPIVLSLGEILWDMIPEGKRAGGAPVNFIYHATKNGADGYSISAIGQDELGDELLAAVEKTGIKSILQRNAYPTGRADVKLENGIPEWTIVKDVAWDHIALTQDLIDLVRKADAICYGSLACRMQESHDTIMKLLKLSRPETLRYYDINIRGDHYSKELIEEQLADATVFKLNDDELVLLRPMFGITGTDEEACKWFMDNYDLDYVILTAGADFSTILAKDGEISTLPTPRVEVSDTIGAGDSFSGAFTINILLGKSLKEAHRAAVNTAAYVCTQAGAWPDYPEVMPDYIAEYEAKHKAE